MDCAYAGILSVQSVKQTVVIERMSPGYAQQQGRLIDNEQMLVSVEQSNGFLRVRNKVRGLWVCSEIQREAGPDGQGRTTASRACRYRPTASVRP